MFHTAKFGLQLLLFMKFTIRTFYQVLALMCLILLSCKGRKTSGQRVEGRLKEGTLVYAISGQATTRQWEMTVQFDSGNAVITEKFARGAGRKFICDKRRDEILCLYDDAESLGISKASYFLYATQEQLIRQAMSSHYGDTTISVTQEFKDILGYKCQKYIIRHGDQVTVEVWLTDLIEVGVIYPWTPLTFSKVALEYELKILGATERHYKIESISQAPIDKKEFEHTVPDEYSLIIPICTFSIDTGRSNNCVDNVFQSLSYPSLGGGRQETINFLSEMLHSIIPASRDERVDIEFVVGKDGRVSDIDVSINFSNSDKRVPEITSLIRNIKGWIPAKVRGKAVKARVSIVG